MTTEKYLRRLTWLVNTITSRAERVDFGRARATNMVVPTDNDPVQSSPRDTLCEILSDVVDTDKELQGYKAEFKYIMGQVNELTGEDAPAYLWLRYVKDKNMSEIASDMNISRSTAYRIHREALAEFEFLYGETYNRANNFRFMEHFDTL